MAPKYKNAHFAGALPVSEWMKRVSNDPVRHLCKNAKTHQHCDEDVLESSGHGPALLTEATAAT